ncbi:hypothetical protein WP50_19120, partial [Lactiplantibacillus plantarum]
MNLGTYLISLPNFVKQVLIFALQERTDVYDAIVGQLGAGFGDADASAVAMEKEANRVAWQKMTPWQKVKHGFSILIGIITGSMIPVIVLLAASGILKRILSLLKNFNLVSATTPTAPPILAV